MFSGCANFTGITLPSTLTEIGQSAFTGCTNLTDIFLPDNLTRIGAWAFSGCENLEEIWVDDAVVIIGYDAFINCPKLVLHGNSGSNIESIAAEHNIPFSTMPLIANQLQIISGCLSDINNAGIAGAL